MLIKRKFGWEIPENRATPEDVYWNRREILAGLGLGGAALAVGPGRAEAAAGGLYPAERNPAYQLDRPLSPEYEVTHFNNFYEFGSHKKIARRAQRLTTDPWSIRIDGLVEKDIRIDFEDLVRKMPLEERLYRHRCVEAWSMAVPWTGFPMRALVEMARPLSKAKYVRMETFHRPRTAQGQKQSWYPWPYIEGVTMAEATNELAFLVTGLYGKPVPKQNGAPIRLALPWKYGFKSIKSIVRFQFTDKRPVSFWEDVTPHEYGFWANVNPDVPHPRWSQSHEELLGTGEVVPTQLYNGYAEQVAGLYRNMTLPDKTLFR